MNRKNFLVCSDVFQNKSTYLSVSLLLNRYNTSINNYVRRWKFDGELMAMHWSPKDQEQSPGSFGLD